jgi:hypothetical protein
MSRTRSERSFLLAWGPKTKRTDQAVPDRSRENPTHRLTSTGASSQDADGTDTDRTGKLRGEHK